MRKIALALSLALMFAGVVHAKTPKLYLIDMTGKRFTSGNFNMMEDGLPGNVDGFGIQLNGQLGKDFTVQAKGSEAGVRCGTQVAWTTPTQTALQILENVDVDSGQTCNFLITYRNGAHALLKVYSEGT